MYIIMIILAIVIVIAAFVLIKNNQTKKRIEEERLRKIAEEEERQRQLLLEEEARKAARKAEIQAGKDIYHYLNQSIKTMFFHYRTEKWDELKTLGVMELQDRQAARRCVDKLSKQSQEMVKAFFAYIDLDDLFEGEGNVINSQELKHVFESMMLPFFPVYYKEFSAGPRYISFLNQQILKVFTQLSGKKFRPGYKNRYQNGQIAFEWTNDIYRVYNMEGKQLCQASFKNGKVCDGYAILKKDDAEEEMWDVFQKGVWKEGSLQKEDLYYHYNVEIGN